MYSLSKKVLTRTLGRLLSLEIALLCASLSTLAATNTASLRMSSDSVRVDPGRATILGAERYEISFSSYFDWDNANGEFYWFSQTVPTHYSGLTFKDLTTPGLPGVEGEMLLGVLEETDVDGDYVPDFYQTEHGVNVEVADGSFVLFDPADPAQDLDSGSVTIRWQRTAGQARGSCTLTLEGTQVLTVPTVFEHQFEILEYAGTLRYVPSRTDEVAGQIDLTQTGNGSRSWTGPLTLLRAPDDPDIDFELSLTTWTNHLDDEVDQRETTGYLELDPSFEWEYWGLVDLQDGDPSTPDDKDYNFCYLTIDDPNDYNGDGTPDLSDPPPPLPLELGISIRGNTLTLAITGDIGVRFEIERTTSLDQPDWATVLPEPIILTTNPQSVDLPVTPGEPSFYRLKESVSPGTP